MKIKLFGILLVLSLAMFLPTMAHAQFDLGNPDTLILLTNRPEVGVNETSFIVELWVYNDGNGVAPQFGFSWDTENITLDSAKAAPVADAAFDQVILYDQASLPNSNTNNRAVFSGISLFGNTIPANASRQIIATYYFTIGTWDAGSSITVDSSEWDNGSEMLFVTAASDSYTPVYYWGDNQIVVMDPSDVDDNALPATYSLGQNYPNPFNPTTSIDFSLENAGEYSITVYNVIGQVVWEEKGTKPAGSYTTEWNATNQSSGVYFYKLQSGSFTETKKMMLVK